MAREYSDPDISQPISQLLGRGIPGVQAPRAPIKPTAPDSGPPIGMTAGTAMPMSNMTQTQTPNTGSTAPGAGTMYIPGASRHEVIHIDEGAHDRTMDYPVGTGAWQSRTHAGTASSPDNSLRPQGEAPRGPDMPGASDAQYDTFPVHTSSGEESGNHNADPNAKDYSSEPCHMDYTCDMGGICGSH